MNQETINVLVERGIRCTQILPMMFHNLGGYSNEISEVIFYQADFDDIATQLGFTDEEKEVDNDDWLDEILAEKRLSGYLCKLQMQMRNSWGETWNKWCYVDDLNELSDKAIEFFSFFKGEAIDRG